MTWPSLLLFCIVSGCAAGLTAQTTSSAKETEAIARAEQFVRMNGYVRREDADLVRANREAIDRPAPMAELVEQRAGTLLGFACGVSRATSASGWLVVFCYDPRHFTPSLENAAFVRKVGRGVSVFDDGSVPVIEHQDVRLTSSTTKPLGGMDELDRLLAETEQ